MAMAFLLKLLHGKRLYKTVQRILAPLVTKEPDTVVV